MIAGLYAHRGYIWRAAWSDVRFRYAGAGLGTLWNVLQPLAMILVFTLVFTKVMRREGISGVPYPVYLCSALLPWIAFSDCLTRCTHAFVSHAIYLRKLPVPEQVFAAQGAVAATLTLAISFALLIVLATGLGCAPSWHWVLLPIPLLLLMGLGLGVGTALGTVHAFIRDVGQALPVVLQIGFWLYPIVYHASFLPQSVQQMLPWNPVYPYLETVRALFLEHRMPPAWLWGAMVAWTAAGGVVGHTVLRRLRHELRDVI